MKRTGRYHSFIKLADLNKEIVIQRHRYFNNIFFVTFKQKRIHDAILDEMSSKDTFLSKLFHAVNKNTMNFDDGRIVHFRLKQAPEPSDINWHNLSATNMQKFKSRMLTYLASFLLIGIGFGIVLGLKVWQRYLGNQLASSQAFDVSSLTFRAVSVLISIVILLVNSILPMAMRHLTLMEKQTSNTDFFDSLTFKISFVK